MLDTKAGKTRAPAYTARRGSGFVMRELLVVSQVTDGSGPYKCLFSSGGRVDSGQDSV